MVDEPLRILTDREVDAAIPELIREAQSFFTLVSPNTSFEGSWLANITNATQRGIEVCVVYNPREFGDEIPNNQHLIRLPKEVKQYGVDYLHAKIYMTDKSVIITSMNYTNWSNKNREIAVRFDRDSAGQAYKEVQTYVDELLGKLPIKAQGFCIRCGKNDIHYNRLEPMCATHLRTWRRYNNPNYPENYCHSCGNKMKTTFADPLCSECF